MSVRPSLCLSIRMEQLPLDGFWSNFIFDFFFQNPVEKIQASLKSEKNKEYFT
jgi:hypothetical protein